MPKDASKTPFGKFFERFLMANWIQVGTEIGSQIDVNFDRRILTKIYQNE